jgi:competence protein ComEC
MRFEFRQMLAHSNLQHKGLLLALLTGDESLLAKDLKKKFQQLGISHLLAISGPHVLIFAIMLTWGLQRVLQHYFPNLYLWQPRQIILAFPFLFSVMVYVAFVGFEIPALRTLLTVALASFFVITRQAIQPFQLLIYSACLFLIYDPFSILSAAFWLSYGACFILLRIYQTISTLPKDRIKNRTEDIKFAIKILIESQWKIFIALMPLVIIFSNKLLGLRHSVI